MVWLSMLAVSNIGLVAGQPTDNNMATLENIADHITMIATSLVQVEQQIEQMNTWFVALSEQVGNMSSRVEQIGERIGTLLNRQAQSDMLENLSKKMTKLTGDVTT